MRDNRRNFKIRTLSGALFVAEVLIAILASKWGFGLLLLAIVAGGMVELYRMGQKKGYSPQYVLGLVCGLGVYALTFNMFYNENMLNVVLPFIILLILVLPAILIAELNRGCEHSIENLGVTFLGIAYIALPVSVLSGVPLLLNGGEWSPWVMIAYMFVIWANDSFAYLAGVFCGRHIMAANISPNKTWEGFAGGVIGAMVIGVAAAYILGASIWVWLGLSFIVAITGVLGDFVESLLKRSAQVKDSGDILAGHGGWLDRFDALILSAPFAFVYLLILNALGVL